MREINTLFLSLRPSFLLFMLSFFAEDILIKAESKIYNDDFFKTELFCADVIVLEDSSITYEETELLKSFVKNNKNKKILCTSSFTKNYIKSFIDSGIESIISKRVEPEILKEAIIKTANGEKYIGDFIKKYCLSYNDPKFTCLSAREKEIFLLSQDSFTNKEIAEKLYLSVKTVEAHKENIKKKLKLKSVKELYKLFTPPPVSRRYRV